MRMRHSKTVTTVRRRIIVKEREAEDSELSELPDGTIVRHRYQRGDYGGETVEATAPQGGRLSVEDDTKTRVPRKAARVADKQLRGDDASRRRI